MPGRLVSAVSGESSSTKTGTNTTMAKSQGVPKMAPGSKGVQDSGRRLATVRMIEKVEQFSHDLQILTIDGWTVVTRRAMNVKRNELVLFLETDAFLPLDGPYSAVFSEVGNKTFFDGKTGYRVGTTNYINGRKRKVMSQGFVFKLHRLGDIDLQVAHLAKEYPDKEQLVAALRNIDFSGDLGIRKWESHSDGTSNRRMPEFIIKTETERVQNCPNLFKNPKYKWMTYQESEKMDGAAMSCYFVPTTSKYYACLQPEADPLVPDVKGRFGVCSRNRDLRSSGDNIYWKTALQANLHKILQKVGKALVIQGELVGHNINGNRYHYPPGKTDLFIYSITDIEKHARMNPTHVERFAREHNLKHVPVLGYVRIPTIASSHQELIDRADKRQGEGLVFKNCTDGRWFKVLSPSYILAHGDEAQACAQAKDALVPEKKPVIDVKGKGKEVIRDAPRPSMVAQSGPKLAPQPSTPKSTVAEDQVQPVSSQQPAVVTTPTSFRQPALVFSDPDTEFSAADNHEEELHPGSEDEYSVTDEIPLRKGDPLLPIEENIPSANPQYDWYNLWGKSAEKKGSNSQKSVKSEAVSTRAEIPTAESQTPAPVAQQPYTTEEKGKSVETSAVQQEANIVSENAPAKDVIIENPTVHTPVAANPPAENPMTDIPRFSIPNPASPAVRAALETALDQEHMRILALMNDDWTGIKSKVERLMRQGWGEYPAYKVAYRDYTREAVAQLKRNRRIMEVHRTGRMPSFDPDEGFAIMQDGKWNEQEYQAWKATTEWNPHDGYPVIEDGLFNREAYNAWKRGEPYVRRYYEPRVVSLTEHISPASAPVQPMPTGEEEDLPVPEEVPVPVADPEESYVDESTLLVETVETVAEVKVKVEEVVKVVEEQKAPITKKKKVLKTNRDVFEDIWAWVNHEGEYR